MNPDISIQKAKWALAHTKGLRLIDVRSAQEYKSGHIAGSTNIPLNRLGNITKMIPGKSTPIFVCCKSGNRSAQAKTALLSMGYTDVTNIGSISGWQLS